MRSSRRAALAVLLLSLGPGLAACRRHAAPAPTSDAAAVAATINGEAISMAEVDRRVLEQYARGQMYDLRRRVLDQVLADRLLEHEAKARGMTRDQLLKLEVDSKVPPPSEEEVQYRFVSSGLEAKGGTLLEFRPRIEKAIHEGALNARRGAFMEELSKKAQVKVLLTEPRVALSFPADAPALGPEKAPVTLVEFLDYQCTYCQRAEGVVEQVLAQYQGKVRFVHRDFPLDGIHPQAMKAARAARCAGEQGKFWEFHKSLLAQPGHEDADLKGRAATLKLDADRFSTCLASDKHDADIASALEQGRQAGVNATPTFFINGRRLEGARDLGEFKKVIDEELAKS